MSARTRSITTAAALAAALTIAAGACGGTSISQEVARDQKVDVDMAAITAAGVPGVSIVIRDWLDDGFLHSWSGSGSAVSSSGRGSARRRRRTTRAGRWRRPP
ncbi:MAG: hypothetical protein QOH36_879 [Actinomycetota bacterium]|nr:hypothetical protein [Actinomycetota bacterium]